MAPAASPTVDRIAAGDAADPRPSFDAPTFNGYARLADAGDVADAARDPEEAVAALRPLFLDLRWLEAMAAQAAEELAADPMRLFGLSAMTAGALQQLVLLSGERFSVTLAALSRGDAARQRIPQSHAFVGNRSLLRLLTPDPLDARLVTLSRATGVCRDRRIRVTADRLFEMDERRRVLWIAQPDRQALFLRARIKRSPAPLVRTYRVGEARPSAFANGDDGLARSLAMMAVLRTLGSAPPVDALRALLPRAHGAQRWQIMREMLAVDTPAAFPDLDRMARDESDPAVRHMAASILTRLSPEVQPCPM